MKIYRKIVILSLTLILFSVSSCTTSNVIMTGTARAPISPAEVRMYLREPSEFKSVGLITASSNSTPIRSINRKKALQELQDKAATLGANGVLLRIENGSPRQNATVFVPTGTNTGFVTSGRGTEVEVQGEAIYVVKE